MDFVKLIKERENHYEYEDANNHKMQILGLFLASEVGCYWPSFKEWGLHEEDPITAGGNITGLEKDEHNVILSDLYSEQPDGGPYLIIPRDEFVRILDEWEHICKTQPREVLITKDGYKFHIETKE